MSENIKESEKPLVKKLIENPKFLGIVISMVFIVIGMFLWNPDRKEGKGNCELGKDFIEMEKQLIELTIALEKHRCDMEKNRNGTNVVQINLPGAKNTQQTLPESTYKNIEALMEDIREYICFQKRVIAAHIFFRHILKLLFIFSGILGLLLISVWKYREDMLKKESEL